MLFTQKYMRRSRLHGTHVVKETGLEKGSEACDSEGQGERDPWRGSGNHLEALT